MSSKASAQDGTGSAPALTPEARAAQGRWHHELGRLGPGSRVFEVIKRAGLGVFNDGFIHAGNLAYLALMTLFPFFITAAAVLSLFGQSAETQRAVESFLRVMPGDVATLLRKPTAAKVDVDVEYVGFDIDNLWICDNSTFTSALSVNPALTQMALSLRTADALIDGLKQA